MISLNNFLERKLILINYYSNLYFNDYIYIYNRFLFEKIKSKEVLFKSWLFYNKNYKFKFVNFFQKYNTLNVFFCNLVFKKYYFFKLYSLFINYILFFIYQQLVNVKYINFINKIQFYYDFIKVKNNFRTYWRLSPQNVLNLIIKKYKRVIALLKFFTT